MMRDGVESRRRESTQPMGNVPETEPRPELSALPFNDDEPDQGKRPEGLAPGATREAQTETTFRELRYRAHRYHGITRMKPPVSQHTVDIAASALVRTAIKTTHALRAEPKYDPNNPDAPCACIYCA